MTELREEAYAIARLYGRDPNKVVGWLYRWNTREIAILWTGRKRAVRFVDPLIDLEEFCYSSPPSAAAAAHLARARARPPEDR